MSEIDYTAHGINWRNCPTRGDEHHAHLHESVDSLLTERDALRAEIERLRAALSSESEEVGGLEAEADMAAERLAQCAAKLRDRANAEPLVVADELERLAGALHGSAAA